MSFKKTGKVEWVKREESLAFCDHCDKQISISIWRSNPHWELTFDPEISEGESPQWDFCSASCLAKWAEAHIGKWPDQLALGGGS